MEPGVGWALLAAGIWGVFLYALKRYFDTLHPLVVVTAINAAAVTLYLPYAALTLDPARVPDGSTFGVLDVAVLAGTVTAIAVAFILFLRALDGGDVSYVAPINKIVPVFVLPIEVVLLGQYLEPLEVLGVVVATVAVYVANYERGPLTAPIRRAATSRAAQFALLSAMCYAAADVGKRVALQELALPPQLWVPMIQVGIVVLIFPLARRHLDRAALRTHLPALVGTGALVAVGEHVTSLAFAVAPASIASPIINTQAIVAVILGGVLLDETALRIRLAAAVLAVVGVGLIAT